LCLRGKEKWRRERKSKARWRGKLAATKEKSEDF
jgi:hypothetical protein